MFEYISFRDQALIKDYNDFIDSAFYQTRLCKKMLGPKAEDPSALENCLQKSEAVFNVGHRVVEPSISRQFKN